MPKKITYKFVKEEFEKYGYTPKFTKYINSSTKLDYICPNGHEHIITWDMWKQGQRCGRCKGNIEVKFEDIKKSFEKYNYICLEDTYINSSTKMRYICDKGHEHSISWDDWKAGKKCPYCSGNNKHKLNNITVSFKKEDYIVKDLVYTNAKDLLTTLCPNNHEYKVSWDNWSSKGRRCPKCSGHGVSKQEKEVLEFIKSIL